MSEQGKLADREQPDVWWECVEGALADAGLGLRDLDGLIGPAPDGYGVRHALPASAVADVVGHPLRFHANTGVGAASQAAGVGLAALAVANGLAEVVVIPTAAAGSGAGYTAADRNAAVEHMAKLGSPFEAVMGTTRVADFAMVARRHMYEYGTTSEQLAEVAVGAAALGDAASACGHARPWRAHRGRSAGVAHDGRAAPSSRLLSREPGWRLRRRHPTRACRRGRVPPAGRPARVGRGSRLPRPEQRARAHRRSRVASRRTPRSVSPMSRATTSRSRACPTTSPSA